MSIHYIIYLSIDIDIFLLKICKYHGIISVMTTVPLVDIRYSYIYDQKLRELHGDEYPQKAQIIELRKRLEKKWEQSGDITLALVAEIVGYDWPFEAITAYVTGIRGAFSDPLTVGFSRGNSIGPSYDTLTHELLHNYITLAIPDVLYAKYRNLFSVHGRLVINHIALHAIHHEVYRAQKRYAALNANRQKDSRFPAYKKSWEIVEEIGAKNIIAMLQE